MLGLGALFGHWGVLVILLKMVMLIMLSLAALDGPWRTGGARGAFGSGRHRPPLVERWQSPGGGRALSNNGYG